jgi:hypothetical protein
MHSTLATIRTLGKDFALKELPFTNFAVLLKPNDTQQSAKWLMTKNNIILMMCWVNNTMLTNVSILQFAVLLDRLLWVLISDWPFMNLCATGGGRRCGLVGGWPWRGTWRGVTTITLYMKPSNFLIILWFLPSFMWRWASYWCLHLI